TEGFTVSVSSSLDAARAHLARHPVNVILLDLKLPDGEGLSLVDALDPVNAPAVVLITGEASLESAVNALRRGVTDYLTKPVDTTRLRSILGQHARSSGLASEIRKMTVEADATNRFGHIIGVSPAMKEIFRLVSRIAPSSASVLLSGESGTGKEVVARTLHDYSRRRGGPFVAVNCGAIPPTLMESELFGHERGAFTGAERRHRGMFERAHQGTLFLDEITEMPLDLQVKFLRVLESGLVRRLGSEDNDTVDVRVFAATNRNADDAVEKGKLRHDLYYRLKVFHITLPPLRERPEDIEPLVQHFMGQFAEREGESKSISPAAVAALARHAWPGNVRELRNVVYSGFVLADKQITPDVLPLDVRTGVPQPADGDTVVVQVGTPLADAERRIVLATLASLGGNKTRTAETLGISLKTLYARLAEYKGATGSDASEDE
ncbi:MAG TPA: sigma-54 dependent transcriptional regulator, partial [Vicinamibacterales bacterium]|nr:sigma-54 dependent transcriptional regulator [Vicinamibacterales bacterium]